ncbi:restriction endonuclease subunit S [Streptococcus anginosus]|uniref:restriction endonuclease subunit S n=1 Tax=Streptococcus anginosus TaxID=1328 RepID=UPI000C7B764E|nr:restriction endonuclease subunit S [Streptococcus anginosus]PLA03134.1 restriction endonuclease subunit S [Streptococcus anginosus]
MNILEEIQNCSVEWKELGEVVDYEQPTKYIVSSKAYTESNEIPVLTAGQSFILGYTNEKDGIYQASKNNPVIIFDDFTTSKQWVDFKFKVKSSAMKMLTIKDEFKSEVLLRYVWHYLGTINYKPDQHGRQWIGTYSKFLIPILPLEIQEKIVQILDKFTEYVTELTSELTSELTLRQKQYSYFRDYLLNFDEDGSGGANNKVYQVEWKTLGEVGKVSMCRRILKNQTSDNGEVPFYKIGTFGKVATSYISRELFENYKLRFSYPKLGDILISASGTIGRTVVFNGEDSYFQDSNIVWLDHDESQVLNRYLYYFYQMNPWKVSDGGTISRLYNGNIEKTRIPVPSLEIQSRIVQVLDNFDTVCHDLNIGLPKEIELRQKQYEYFREKLLTFVAEGVYTESRVE